MTASSLSTLAALVRVDPMPTARLVRIAALMADLRTVAATPADDPRRAEFVARKAALLAEVED